MTPKSRALPAAWLQPRPSVSPTDPAASRSIPPPHRPRVRRYTARRRALTEGAAEVAAGRERVVARDPFAAVGLEASPVEGPGPCGLEVASAPLDVEGRARREALAAGLLERREELERHHEGEAAPGGRDRSPARSGRVADGARREPVQPAEDVAAVDAELHRVPVGPDRKIQERPNDLRRPDRVRPVRRRGFGRHRRRGLAARRDERLLLRGRRRRQVEPPDVDSARRPVEEIERAAVRRGRRSEGAARHPGADPGRGPSVGRRRDDVPRSGTVGRHEDRRAVRAPRRRGRGGASDRDLGHRAAPGRQDHQPPPGVAVQQRRDARSVRREPRLRPDGPVLRGEPFARDLASLAGREVDAHERRRAETRPDGDGEEAVGRRVGLRHVGSARHAVDRAPRPVPEVEVPAQHPVGVRGAPREEHAASVRHPARIRRRVSVEPRQRAEGRALGLLRREVPDGQQADAPRRIAADEELRAVGRNLRRERRALEREHEVTLDEARRLQPLLLVERAGRGLGDEAVRRGPPASRRTPPGKRH